MMFIDKELEAHRQAHEDKIKQVVPEHTKEALERYVHDGISPGGFLLSVLRNDLMGAYGRADNLNIKNMFAIVKYVYNDIPRSAHGSEEAIENWIEYVRKKKKEQ